MPCTKSWTKIATLLLAAYIAVSVVPPVAFAQDEILWAKLVEVVKRCQKLGNKYAPDCRHGEININRHRLTLVGDGLVLTARKTAATIGIPTEQP